MKNADLDTPHPPAGGLLALPAGCPPRRVLKTLGERFDVECVELARRTTYLDTFDWRLHRRGLELMVEQGPEGELLRLLDDRVGVRRTRLEGRPAFAREIPDPDLSGTVARAAGIRRLLAVATVEERGTRVAVLDAERKTVARVSVGRRVVVAPHEGAPPVELGEMAEIQPLRGYPGAAVRVREVLERIGLSSPEGNPNELVLALAALGRAPGDYSSKLQIVLEPDMPAAEALRLILSTLLTTMIANEEGTRRAWDPEFLHDFRVALRRTRAALGQVKGVLAKSTLAPYRSELKWLGEVTGPVRDLDVHLLELPGLAEGAPAELGEALAGFEAELRARHAAAREVLVRALGSERYRRFAADWGRYVETGYGSTGPDARQPVITVARPRLRRAYRRLIDSGRAILPESPPSALHALRIECKKLRYLMEFFRSLFPGSVIAPLIDAQKGLQDNLGRYNDLAVQVDALAEHAARLVEEDAPAAETLLALGRLIERLSREQAKARADFQQAFGQLDSESNRKRFRELFRG